MNPIYYRAATFSRSIQSNYEHVILHIELLNKFPDQD